MIFVGQEPGSDAEILEFCTLTYSVSFPMFAKIAVSGEARHPLYAGLVSAAAHAIALSGSKLREMLASRGIATNPEPEVLWNLEKFLIGRDGEAITRPHPI